MARTRSAKKEALELIEKLPAQVSWDDIMYELYVRQRIATGVAAADAGEVISHEEVRRRVVRASPIQQSIAQRRTRSVRPESRGDRRGHVGGEL